ncbi:DUF1972 domain-containing protein [Melaminivora jejuensis]|uniref:DUF1972 domain-containing protein n=1 Tax=Melaminivora jejuensis TaxID=1267217 RepID=UPI001E4E2FCB|nr:DUF1972 domain-containing protein [Melaminivora jejuensis]UHJ64544.1 DUF1972 domain-containing protein [Melaminivora jejuensis]
MSAAGTVPAPGTPTARLRIAILGTRGIPAGYGGFETFAEQLAVRLAARGHQVTVYAEAEGRAPGPDRCHQGVRVRERRRPHWGPASTLAYDSACLWDARRGHDLVYMLGYGAAWACWLPRALGTPVWINVDGLEWARSKWSAPARLYLRCMEWLAPRTATRLIADAQAIAARMQERYPRGAPCSFIAYGAEPVGQADPARLAQWGLEPGGYLLAVARPEPENHVLEIIEGCLLQPAALPLVVVGQVRADGSDYQRRLLALAGPRVRFIGGVYEPAQLQSLRLHAACHLHGHSVGGTNPSLLEALACGNWVIAHDNPFNREVARDAADYFADPAALAAALAAWAATPPAQRRARAARARQIIARHYTWEQIADRYEALALEQCRAGRQQVRA